MLPLLVVSRSLTWRASKLLYLVLISVSDKRRFRSIVDELKPTYTDVGEDARQPECVSIAWSADGQTLYGGFTDHVVRIWGVSS